MVQYRDLNAPPSRMLADVVADMRASGRESKTGDAGVKDLGETGDVVWPRPDGTAVSVRDIDGELGEARQRIDEAVADLVETGTRLDAAEQTVGVVRDGLDVLETVTLPGAVADLEAADQANAQAVADAEARSDQARADLAAQIDQDIADTADALSSDINSVRTSVDGKSKITQSLDAPPAQYAGAVGDRWERMSSMGSGGRLVSNWRWNGTVWVSTIIDGAVLGNVDASKIVVGTMEGARIRAGSITADRLVVGVSQNLVVDAKFRTPEINAARSTTTWSPVEVGNETVMGNGGSRSIRGASLYLTTSGTSTPPEVRLAIYNSTKWTISVELYVGDGAQFVDWVYFGGVAYRSDGSIRNLTSMMMREDGTSAVHAGDGWVRLSTAIDFSVYNEDFVAVAPRIITAGGAATGGGGGGWYYLRNPHIAEQVGTTLIEPGAVTTDRLAANSVVAGKIASGAVETQHLKAGAITVGTVDGLSDELAGKETPAGAQAKADAAKSAAESAAAAEYGETKTLVGGWRETGQTTIAGGAITTDSITSGHLKSGAVTTSKLAVTEDMSAAIVNAMSVNAKEAVITEGLTANAATLIGQTVVDDINVQGKLVGTDGVFTGTVDFENVNVTGELLANEISGERIYGTVLEGGEVRAGGGTTGDIVVLGDDTFHPSDGTAPRPGLMVAEGGKTYTRVPGVGVSANGGVEVSGGATPEGGNAYMYTSPFGVFAYSNPGSNSRTGYSTRLGVGMDGAELLAQKNGEATVSMRASAPLVSGGQTLLPPRAIIQVSDSSGVSNIDVRAERAQLTSGSREIRVDASGVWAKSGSDTVSLIPQVRQFQYSALWNADLSPSPLMVQHLPGGKLCQAQIRIQNLTGSSLSLPNATWVTLNYNPIPADLRGGYTDYIEVTLPQNEARGRVEMNYSTGSIRIRNISGTDISWTNNNSIWFPMRWFSPN